MRALRRLQAWPWLKRRLLDLETELTRKLGLFDREHYLSQVDSQQLAGTTPLRHYIQHGDALGLSPTPLLDVAYFDGRWGRELGVNRLLYYGLSVRHTGESPTPWFDPDYYLQANPDVQQSGTDPLLHFAKWGWKEGRNPIPGLDMQRLLGQMPQWRISKRSPLSLLASGELAQRMAGEPGAYSGRDTVAARSPVARAAPEFSDAPGRGIDLTQAKNWAHLRPRAKVASAAVDVLIPVYSGLQETLRCLWSVLDAAVSTDFELVVINDAGPVAELNTALRTLAAQGLFTLDVHRHNQGFVRTVNAGLRKHKDRDVVILNADTEVYAGWLDRLLKQARLNPDAASITPLSNNATICSYPDGRGDKPVNLEVSHRHLDALCARVNAGLAVDAPTGVGFCMYMRRAAIREVGLLDEKRFGRGYGEENDWCQRALARGWRNLIAADIYVRHVGSVSFKAEAHARIQAALKVLAKLYPHYHGQVQGFISADPLRPHRARVDLARLAEQSSPRNVLLVCHNRGGGTERHLLEQTQQLMAEGAQVFELRPSSRAGCVAIQRPGIYGLDNLAALPVAEGMELEGALRSLPIHEIHLHHLIDFPPHTGALLAQICQQHGIALRMAVHDYYLICPRVNMVTSDQGRHCGTPSLAQCNQCLKADGLIERTGPIEAWRTDSIKLARQAQVIVVPSVDVAQRMNEFLTHGLPVQVEPHEADPPAPTHGLPVAGPSETVRVLVVGAISWIKGFGVLRDLALAARAESLPLSVSLLGYSMDDPTLIDAGVHLLGRYFDHELAQRIDEANPHVIFLPSIWPETYCYALTGAMHGGRRIAVFDLGAQAHRTRDHHPGHLVLPLDLADAPQRLAAALIDGARQTNTAPA